MRVTDGYLVYAVPTHSVSQSLCGPHHPFSKYIFFSLPCRRSLNACFAGPVATQAHAHTHTRTHALYCVRLRLAT